MDTRQHSKKYVVRDNRTWIPHLALEGGIYFHLEATRGLVLLAQKESRVGESFIALVFRLRYDCAQSFADGFFVPDVTRGSAVV